MADGSKSAGYQRTLDKAAVMVCAVLLVLVTPLVLWSVAGFLAPAWPPVRRNRSEKNCASSMVHELAVIGNVSVDPCHDFSHYACFNHELLARSDVRRDVFFKAVGTLKGQASLLLNHLYTSCMKRMANYPVTPESASTAFLDAVRSWGVGANGSVNVASIVASMDIRYSMKMGMEFEMTTMDSEAKLAVMTIRALELRDVHVPGVDNDIFYNRSLLALSRALGHTVTANDVRALIVEVRRQSAGKNGTKRGHYSLLAEIYQTPLLDAMIKRLCNCKDYIAVEVHRADAIVAQLEVFGRQEFRPTVLAYLSLWASVDLLSGEINATYAGGYGAEHSTADKMRYCVEYVMRFKHVWDIIAVEKLRTREKDRALRTVYQDVLAAILAEFGDMFADSGSVASLIDTVSRLGLLLPAELVEPYRRILPSREESHAASALALREFLGRARVLDSSRGLLEAWSHRDELFDELVRVTSRFVIFAPTVYSELRLECGTEALFLNAHLVGVHLVDGLVQRLCLRREGAHVVAEAALGRLCVEDPRRLMDVLYPQLSLRVVGRALKKSESWHHRAFAWGPRKMSESQLFYQLFYVREVCAHAERLQQTQLEESAQLMMASEDFRKAFGCLSVGRRLVAMRFTLT
ncbi:hypothetical protein HPB50_026653 [Hyalomma asiaticum]|uniref:Uncharacterized protein n=1 Tax=Hyalomma asiaticum TaxID=266040 RepID=A0ACB7RPN6_HYAAI|nr:hypothetical protein HPB50_026653 [Hyalomma asiaticum]